jgi:CDP-glycerol glycerophosphotransferase
LLKKQLNTTRVKTSLDSIPNKSALFIYGTGSAGKSLFAWLSKCRRDVSINGFLDSNHSGTLLSLPVHQFTSNSSLKKSSLILVASTYYHEVITTLKENGYHNFLVVSPPSYLMGEIFHNIKKSKQDYLKVVTSFDGIQNLHFFFGEHGGNFVGNNKYYFLHRIAQGCQNTFWITEKKEIFDTLASKNLPVKLTQNEGFWIQLNTGKYFYFDNMTWQRKYPFLKHYPAKKIHTSHGVGLKLTEIMMIPTEFRNSLSDVEENNLQQSIMKNDLLVSTSEFYRDNVSVPAYGTTIEKVTLSGYPKNDIFYNDVWGEDIYADCDTLQWIDSQKTRGKKILFYAPTFRDMNADFSIPDQFFSTSFSDFLENSKAVLIIKGHASSKNSNTVLPKNLRIHKNDCDGYPALKKADLLITDYSSIYMDALHLDIPLVFFPYDWDTYTDIHRQLQFNYQQMTPGPKCYTMRDLQNELAVYLVEGLDFYSAERLEIRNMAFTYSDGNASQRLDIEIKTRFEEVEQ